MPLERVEIAKVARPLLRVAVPSVTAPSVKVTEPVGVPEPGDFALTVAVNVTCCPLVDGFLDEVRAVVVDDWLTVWVNPGDALLPTKLVFPA